MKLNLPFLGNGRKAKRDLIIAVDLGGRSTKAVVLQREDDTFILRNYALLDAPIYEKSISAELLSEHLKTVVQAMGAKTKSVILTVGANDALVRPVEVPMIPIEDLRSVLKINSKSYLQQDLSNHVFDCHLVLSAPSEKREAKSTSGIQKQKVLVAGARQQLTEDLARGARLAGLSPEHIIPSLLGPVNAFELALNDMFKGEPVALVDLGFKHSSICIINQGELMLSRVVNIGGDRLTTGLSETMNVSYAEAEGIKIGMAHEVASALEGLLLPLGRELRASIDFFEHQQDKAVHTVFLSGASAQSELIARALQTELLVDCKPWHAIGVLKLELPAQQAAEIEQVAPQLTAAIGAALAAL